MAYAQVLKTFKSISGRRCSLLEGERYFVIAPMSEDFVTLNTADSHPKSPGFKRISVPKAVFCSFVEREILKLELEDDKNH